MTTTEPESKPSQDRVTIHQVASIAGVSPTTVSNWLNGRDRRMTPETKERISRVIRELGYRPSRVARQLRTRSSQVIGLVVPSVANPFWGGLARIVESAAQERDCQVLLCNSERDPDRERGYVEELWESGVRGVIIGSSLPSLEHLRPAIDRGLRIVAFDREVQVGDPPELVSVSVDNRLGARQATEHLISLGHRRIGFISGPIATVSRINRFGGYRDALANASIDFDPAVVWADRPRGYGDVETAEIGHRGMTALLALAEPPTGVIAINDMYAIGALAALRDAGIPLDEMSVVGFDDGIMAQLFNPALTTVAQPLVELVRHSLDALEEGSTATDHLVLAPSLVVRSTSRAPRAILTHPQKGDAPS